MANPEHEAILRQGVKAWNKWREKNLNVKPDLSGSDFSHANLGDANFSSTDLSDTNFNNSRLSNVNFTEANLSRVNLNSTSLYAADLHNANLNNALLFNTSFIRANLTEAILTDTNTVYADFGHAKLNHADLSNVNLSQAIFTGANLEGTNLSESNLSSVDLSNVNLSHANLMRTNLSNAKLFDADFSDANLNGAILRYANLNYTIFRRANLRDANLLGAVLIETDFERADITNSRIYGISAWNLKNVDYLKQSGLIITKEDEPKITIDNLEIAQFVYLLLNNAKLRSVIDTLTTKSVLILGRFTPERKAILDGIREALRQHGYVPMLFDFDKPANRDLTETIKTLAGLARFVIADLSDPNSIPHELMSFAEGLLSVPVQGIFCPTDEHPKPYPMYEHLRRYPHVLPIYRYDTPKQLMDELEEKVIRPSEEKVIAMRPPK